jgi:hypothetical protein
MEIKDTIVIAEEFADDPGAREEKDGENSGERFYSDFLHPRFLNARKGNYLLRVDLDGVFGYPSSFVSGSFGKLSTTYGADEVLKFINFKSDRRPVRIDKIIYEIKHPIKSKL